MPFCVNCNIQFEIPENSSPARKHCLICSPQGLDGNTRAHNHQLMYPEKRRSADLKCKYGITLDDYQNMVTDQDNKCAICRRDPPQSYKKNLSVDHDHETGTVRGLLCTRCNTMLGWFERYREVVEGYLAAKA